MSIITLGGRCSFPAVVEPKSFQGGPAKYSMALITTADDPQFKLFQQAVQELLQAEFADKTKGVMANIMQDKRLRCFGKGSEKIDANGDVYAGYDGENAVWVSASSTKIPQLVSPSKESCTPSQAQEWFVGGNYVNLALRPWVQNNQFGKAIRAELIAVQFVREGEHFGAAPVNVDELFGVVEGAPAPTAGAFDLLN